MILYIFSRAGMAGSGNAEIANRFDEAAVSDLDTAGRRPRSGAKSLSISKVPAEFDIVSRPLQGVVAFRIYLRPRGDRTTISS